MKGQATQIALLFLLSFFLFFFFLWPKYLHTRQLQLEILTLEKGLENKAYYFENLQKIYQSLIEKPETKKVEMALPLGEDFAQIFNYVQSLTKENGLALKDISFKKGKTSLSLGTTQAEGNEGVLKEIGEINFSFKLVGEYPNFKNFVSKMEKSARLFQINNIQIVPQEKTFEFQIEGKAFYFEKP